MKHITYAEESILVGDVAADVLAEYAAMLASSGGADVITVFAISSDGDEVEATFVLDSGTNLMAETTHSSLPEPVNTDVIEYMRSRIELDRTPRNALPVDDAGASFDDEFGLD